MCGYGPSTTIRVPMDRPQTICSLLRLFPNLRSLYIINATRSVMKAVEDAPGLLDEVREIELDEDVIGETAALMIFAFTLLNICLYLCDYEGVNTCRQFLDLLPMLTDIRVITSAAHGLGSTRFLGYIAERGNGLRSICYSEGNEGRFRGQLNLKERKNLLMAAPTLTRIDLIGGNWTYDPTEAKFILQNFPNLETLGIAMDLFGHTVSGLELIDDYCDAFRSSTCHQLKHLILKVTYYPITAFIEQLTSVQQMQLFEDFQNDLLRLLSSISSRWPDLVSLHILLPHYDIARCLDVHTYMGIIGLFNKVLVVCRLMGDSFSRLTSQGIGCVLSPFHMYTQLIQNFGFYLES